MRGRAGDVGDCSRLQATRLVGFQFLLPEGPGSEQRGAGLSAGLSPAAGHQCAGEAMAFAFGGRRRGSQRMEFFGRDWCSKRAGEADPPTSEPHRVRAIVGTER